MTSSLLKTVSYVSFALTLSACGGGGGDAGETPPTNATPTVSINNVAVPEGDTGTTTLTFTVNLSAAASGSVTVDYATADSTADSADYNATTGTLTIAQGATSANIDIQITPDTEIEVDEEFTVALSSPQGATLGTSVGVGTITNDDFPLISISDANTTEGDNGPTSLDFQITLDRPGLGDITVDYASSNLVAEAGTDFEANSGTVTIPEGETESTISVVVIGDLTPEADEQFVINLLNPSANAMIDDDEGFGIIENDDVARVSVAPASVTEANSGTRTLSIPLSLDVPAEVDINVGYETVDVTALAGADYTGTSGTLIVPAGETSASVNIETLGDAEVENSEFFNLQLLTVDGPAVLGLVSMARGTIVDNDGPPTGPQLSVFDTSVVEGDSGVTELLFTILLDQASGDAVSFDFQTSNGSATSGIDYQTASGTGTIPAGELSTTIAVVVMGDLDEEGNEGLFFDMNNPSGDAVVILGTATGTILDDDQAEEESRPQLTISASSVLEGDAGNTDMVFTVSLSEAATTLVTVDYVVEPLTATENVDYLPVAGTLSFAAGVLTQEVVVPVVGDTFTEDDETFRVRLSNLTGDADLTRPLGNGTILTDEPIARISVNDTSTSEGDAGTSTVRFTVMLSEATVDAVTMDYTTADDTATAGEDYTAISGNLQIPAGETQFNLDVMITGDVDNEDDETFTLELSNQSQNAEFVDASGLGTIINDDGTPGWQTPVILSEGRSVSLTMDKQGRGAAVFITAPDPLVADDTITVAHFSNGWQSPEIVEDIGTLRTGPSATMLNDGGIAVAYRGGSDGMSSAIYRPLTGWNTMEVTSGFGFFPKVRANESGTALYVYESNGNNADPSDVIRATFNQTTDTWNMTELAEFDETGNARLSRVAIDTAGNILMIWYLNSSDLDLLGNYYDYYNASTNAWSGPVLAEELDNTGGGIFPLSEGVFGYAAQVTGFGNNPDSIEFFIYDAATDTWTNTGAVEDEADEDAIAPGATVDGAGNIFVSWLLDGDTRDAYVTRYDAASDTWETPVLLENATGVINSGIRIRADAAGNAIAVWSQSLETGGNSWFRVRAAQYDAASGQWGPPEQIDDESITTGSQFPSIVMDDAGNAAVVWLNSVEGTIGATHYRRP